MARKPRLLIEGGFYHVMLRGNGGSDIFFSDDDRTEFERLVAEGVTRFGHRIHAYCCMTNHVHLAIEAGPTPLSKIIQNLAFRYTRWVKVQCRGQAFSLLVILVRFAFIPCLNPLWRANPGY